MTFRSALVFIAALILPTADALGGAPAPGAGTAHVSGVVVDSRNDRAVAGATIVANGEVVRTDADGAFRIDVPRTTARVDVAADAFEATSVDLDLARDAHPRLRIELVPRLRVEERVEVVGVAGEASTRGSVTEVMPTQVLKVAGAFENVFRVLPTLPGVAATDEASSRISVRGGGPDQNLTVMDGVEIHNPYRIWGLVSAFNPETVSGFELSTGAFSARHGDRLSSVLTVETRAGSAAHALTGSAGMSLTDGNVILEGRLPARRGTWLVTGRRTWYDALAGHFTDSDLPSFGDLQGKAVLGLGGGRSLALSGLMSREKANIEMSRDTAEGVLSSRTTNGVGLGALTLPVGSRVTSRTIVAFYENGDDLALSGRYRNDLKRSNSPFDDEAFAFDEVVGTLGSTVRDFSLREELQFQPFRGHTIEIGGELHDLDTRLDLEFEDEGEEGDGVSVATHSIRADRRDRRYGAWAIHRLALGSRLTVEAGLRYDRSELNGLDELGPRLSTTFVLGDTVRLRAAFGVHSQSPGYEKLAQSDFILDFSARGRLALGNERARHAIVGFEKTFRSGLTARVEGFWKGFDDLLVGRLETPEETEARLALYDFPVELSSSVPSGRLITGDPVNEGRGTAYGFDVFLSRPARKSSRVGGWLAYTHTFADRDVYDRTFPFSYEQRNALSLVGNFRLRPRLELSLTGRFASGFPRTAPVGLRVAATPDLADADGDGNVEELVPERDGQGLLVYAVDYGGLDNRDRARNRFYARLDSRLSWTPGFGRGRLQLYLDVINVLNRSNGEPTIELAHQPGADRPTIVEKAPQGFPFFPSFGIHYRF